MRLNPRFITARRWCRNTLCATLLGALSFSGVHAATPHIKEHQLKARYLDGFTLFVEWPTGTFESTSESLNLCVLGDNPFGRALDILVRKRSSRKTRKSHPQKIHYLRRGDDVSHCHLLYFSDFEESYVYQVLSQLKGKSILTVSSLTRFVEHGGMIQFYVRDNKVRFLVDPHTLRDEGLKIDANLLRVADVASK